MKNYIELQQYIRDKSITHNVCEDEDEYESIENEVVQNILKFAISEGLKVNELDFKSTLELFEIFDEMEDNNTLPPQTIELYRLMKKTFWW